MKMSFVLGMMMVLNIVLSAQNIQNLPQDPRVFKGTLPNGLTYYIVKDEQKADAADFYLLQRSGVLNEEAGELGFSEIISDMAFRGTRNFPGRSIENFLKEQGVRTGENLFAQVHPRYTEYGMVRVPVSDNAVIDSCLLILYDWSCFVDMDNDDLYDGYISPEGRAELSISSTAEELGYYSMFENDSIRSAGGVPTGINVKMLKRFYYKWYRPDLQSIIIIANLDPESVKNKITSLFSSIPKSRYKGESKKFDSLVDRDPVSVSVHNDLSSVRLNLSFAVRNLSASDLQTSVGYMRDYMLAMYSDLLQKRIMEQASRHMLPIYDVEIRHTRPAVGDEFYVLNVEAHVLPEFLDRSLALLSEEIARLDQFGFTSGELFVASGKYMKSLEHAYADRKKPDGFHFHEMCRDNFLYADDLSSIELEYTMMESLKQKVDLDLFNDYTRNLLSRDFCKIYVQLPDIPDFKVDREELLRIFRESWNRNLFSYLDREYKSPKADNMISVVRGGVDESAKHIQYESVEPVTGARVMHLGGGVSIAYLQNTLSEDRLAFAAIKKGGAALWNGNAAGYKALNDLVDLGGVSNLNQLDLSRYMESKGIRMRTFFRPNAVIVNGYAPIEDVDDFLCLLKLWLTDRRVDDLEFYNYRTIKTSEYRCGHKSVGTEMEEIRSALLYTEPELYTSLSEAELESLDYSGLADFCKSEIGTLDGYYLFFVGSMDYKLFKNHVLDYFSENSRSTGRVPVERKLGLRGLDSVHVMGGASIGKSIVDINYVSRCDYNLETVLYAKIFKMFLENVVDDARVTLDFGHYPYHTVSIDLKMETAEHMARETYDKICRHIDSSVKAGISGSELRSIVRSMKSGFSIQEKTQDYWIDVLAHLYLMEQDMHTRRDEILDAVTPEKLRQFILDYFERGNEVVILK